MKQLSHDTIRTLLQDMPVEADGKMHNSDGTTFTSHKDAKVQPTKMKLSKQTKNDTTTLNTKLKPYLRATGQFSVSMLKFLCTT
jgi:hypothetical protein